MSDCETCYTSPCDPAVHAATLRTHRLFRAEVRGYWRPFEPKRPVVPAAGRSKRFTEFSTSRVFRRNSKAEG